MLVKLRDEILDLDRISTESVDKVLAVMGRRAKSLREKYIDISERLDCEDRSGNFDPKWMRDANQAIINEGIRVLESDLEILQEMFNLLGGGIDDLRRIIG